MHLESRFLAMTLFQQLFPKCVKQNLTTVVPIIKCACSQMMILLLVASLGCSGFMCWFLDVVFLEDRRMKGLFLRWNQHEEFLPLPSLQLLVLLPEVYCPYLPISGVTSQVRSSESQNCEKDLDWKQPQSPKLHRTRLQQKNLRQILAGISCLLWFLFPNYISQPTTLY